MGPNTTPPAADPPSGSTGPTGPTPLPGPPGPTGPPGPRQRAGFSVFFDVAETGGLETRIYHEETGDEVVFAGAEPAVWAAWIRDRLASNGAAIDPVVPASTLALGAAFLRAIAEVLDPGSR